MGKPNDNVRTLIEYDIDDVMDADYDALHHYSRPNSRWHGVLTKNINGGMYEVFVIHYYENQTFRIWKNKINKGLFNDYLDHTDESPI